MEEKIFLQKVKYLQTKIGALWMFIYHSMSKGVNPELQDAIQRSMKEVNKLHREMFPEFEHALYADDLYSMLEELEGWQEEREEE